MRLIDADKLIDKAYDVSPAYGMTVIGVTEEDINDAPTVEAIPQADYEFQKRNEYCRGYHDAIRKALKESFNIHCDEGNFKVVQEETLIGLGLSEDEALGDIISRENYETRLKADMVAMLTELQLEIEEMQSREDWCDYATDNCIDRCGVDAIIRLKIHALKENKDEIDKSNK